MQTATVDVPADGNVKAFTIDWPGGLDLTHFLHITLEKTETVPSVAQSPSAVYPLSENFYWLSTASEADHTSLQKLPRVTLDTAYTVKQQGEENVAQVTVNNPTEHLAFAVHLAVRQGKGGPEVAPTYWDDNYFSILPGQRKKVKALFATEDLAGKEPIVTVEGWNVAK